MCFHSPMTEFLNYKVLLQLNDGTLAQGVISHVDGNLITLGNKTISNVLVKDLKVVQLPDLLKPQKKKNKAIDQIDDAIVSVSKGSSRSGTPRLAKQTDFGSEIQDIKASQDFDFAANLAMFDKKTVFAEIQKSDTVSLQDRLVGHNKIDNVNKLKKPAKDKFENDEMVITNKKDNWNSIGSGATRTALPVGTSKNNPRVSLARGETQVAKSHKFVFENASSVPLASPVQLLEIERAALESFAIDLNTSIEVGASSMYNLIVQNILGGSVRLSNKKNHNLPPLVLLLIGNGRCSSRAFAVGRHLTNHGVRVLAYVINETDFEEDLQRQCLLFEKCGGKVVTAEFSVLLDILNNQLETPVELIIDSLQGFEGHLPDLFYSTSSMDSLKRLIEWANEPKQKSKVLSLDTPAGLDGGSGTVLDPELQLHSRYVVSMGLPITGLLHAYNNRNIGAGLDEVSHYVVDVGIPNAVYQAKPHLRKFDKFWFCAESYMKLDVAEI